MMKRGHADLDYDPRLQRLTYEGSGGTEIFLSYEDEAHDVLVGYARLRIPGQSAHRTEIRDKKSAIIRELHVFGQTLPVGTRSNSAFQHRGYGSKLISEAERIACDEYDRDKMVVISALGTKNYYARFGYSHDGPYVSKALK